MNIGKILEDDKGLVTKLVYFIIKEYRFKQDVSYKNMVHISNLIIDDSTAQSLTPTINSILETSLKNDQLLLKLIEVLKKHGGGDIDSDISDSDDDFSSELMQLIEQESDEKKELTEHLDDKIKQSAEYNEVITEEKNQLDKLNNLTDE